MEDTRSFHLAEIGNFLHPSVPISNNEVRNAFCIMISKYLDIWKFFTLPNFYCAVTKLFLI